MRPHLQDITKREVTHKVPGLTRPISYVHVEDSNDDPFGTKMNRVKRIMIQIADSSLDHCQDRDARMGFHICIVGYVFGIPVSLFWSHT